MTLYLTLTNEKSVETRRFTITANSQEPQP